MIANALDILKKTPRSMVVVRANSETKILFKDSYTLRNY